MKQSSKASSDAPIASDIPIETHPFEPFIPEHTRVLIMGTFPPAPSRWTMDFYYPNRINDFWRVMGMVFYDNPGRFYDEASRTFLLDDIRSFLTERGIAMSDTGRRVRRLKANASDAHLEIVEPTDLRALLSLMPGCRAIASTGLLAAKVIASLTDTEVPQMGESVVAGSLTDSHGKPIELWRLPSTSRAYPLSLAKKAEAYSKLFRSIGLL